jgi:hypothetical protein
MQRPLPPGSRFFLSSCSKTRTGFFLVFYGVYVVPSHVKEGQESRNVDSLRYFVPFCALTSASPPKGAIPDWAISDALQDGAPSFPRRLQSSLMPLSAPPLDSLVPTYILPGRLAIIL